MKVSMRAFHLFERFNKMDQSKRDFHWISISSRQDRLEIYTKRQWPRKTSSPRNLWEESGGDRTKKHVQQVVRWFDRTDLAGFRSFSLVRHKNVHSSKQRLQSSTILSMLRWIWPLFHFEQAASSSSPVSRVIWLLNEYRSIGTGRDVFSSLWPEDDIIDLSTYLISSPSHLLSLSEKDRRLMVIKRLLSSNKSSVSVDFARLKVKFSRHASHHWSYRSKRFMAQRKDILGIEKKPSWAQKRIEKVTSLTETPPID